MNVEQLGKVLGGIVDNKTKGWEEEYKGIKATFVELSFRARKKDDTIGEVVGAWSANVGEEQYGNTMKFTNKNIDYARQELINNFKETVDGLRTL